MSEAKRAYDLLRGYVNREIDRVKGLDLADAWRELDSPLNDRQAAKKDKIDSEQGTGEYTYKEPSEDSEEDYEATARLILNVHANATFKEIRHAFEKISRRSQPDNFDDGSKEAEHAQTVLRRATWAYNYLTKNVTASEKRFKSLEIE